MRLPLQTLLIRVVRCRPLWSSLALIVVCACASNTPATTSTATPAVMWQDAYQDQHLGQLAVQLGGSAPLTGNAPLLASGVNLGVLDQHLSYAAGYQLSPGDLLNPQAANTWRDNALPQSIGSQTVQQQIGLQLDPLYGAPITVGARYQQQASWLFSGAQDQRQGAVEMNWAPSFAMMKLNWTPEGATADSTQALQCELAGQVSLPLAGRPAQSVSDSYMALDLGGRACHVAADDEQLAMLLANTWSTGVRWGRGQRETALRLQGVVPLPASGLRTSEALSSNATAYELRLSQKRALGDWQAKAGVAWRRPPELGRGENQTASPWAASMELSRQLAMLALAASWQRGDAYWFLPEVREAADRFALSLDLSPWAANRWHGYNPKMSLSMNWLRADNGSSHEANQAINWNLSIPWQ